MATPVSFAKFWELHLNAMRRAPFDTSNDVADRDMRWYLDEHVDMLFGQNARDDLYHGSSLSSSEDEGLDPKKETIKLPAHRSHRVTYISSGEVAVAALRSCSGAAFR